MAKKESLEDNFARLDQLVISLQSGELSLEEAFKTYQQGMKLVADCNKIIDQVEKKLIVIEEE